MHPVSQQPWQDMNLSVSGLFPPPPCVSCGDSHTGYRGTTAQWHGQMDVGTPGWIKELPGISHLIAGMARPNGDLRRRHSDVTFPQLM